MATRVAALQSAGGMAAPNVAVAPNMAAPGYAVPNYAAPNMAVAPPPDTDDYVRTVTRDSLPRR